MKRKFNRQRIPIEISGRHAHLSKRDADALFGKHDEFKMIRELSQRGQFSTEEKILIKTSKGELSLRVIGPCRDHSQIELSKTDAMHLGLKPKLNPSGVFTGALSIQAKGPKGTVILRQCVQLQQRHLHLSPVEANQFGVQDKEIVSIKISGKRALIFDQVIVRVHPSYRLMLHLDTDEGNAALVIPGKTHGVLCKHEAK